MKKLLGCLGISVLIVFVGFVALVIIGVVAGDTNDDVPLLFLSSLMADDNSGVDAYMHDDLLAQVDQPVLRAVPRACRAVLGDYQALQAGDVEVFDGKLGDIKIKTVNGTLRFAGGTAPVTLTLIDGKVSAFDIQSDDVVAALFSDPEVVAFYRDMGQRFLEACFAGEVPAAHAMLGEAIKKEVPIERLRSVVGEARGLYGAVRSIAFQTAKNGIAEEGFLKLYFQTVCEKATVTSSVDIGFNGMQGKVFSFYLSM